MVKVVYRYLIILFGVLSIVVGILGIILPVLPGIPFFIIALACFDRSSPAFHRALLNVPYLGKRLRDWDKDKRITKDRKKQLYLIVISTFLMSISSIAIFAFEVSAFYQPYKVKLLLIAIMIVILFIVSRIDEK